MDWQQAAGEILRRLDFKTEYQSLGVRVAAETPSSSGWIRCYCHTGGNGAEEKNPSAGINTAGQPPQLGRYKEFTGEGRNLSFFEFAAETGRFATWREARKHYAKQVGVKLPRGEEPPTPADRLVFRAGREHQIAAWCRTKLPITPEAAVAAGMRVAGWPATDQRHTVVALPIYGPNLIDDEPTGWVIWNKTGRALPLYQGKDREPRPMKMLTVTGSKGGWMGRWSLSHLAEAELVWKVEGPGDMLALVSVIPKDLQRQHVVIANSGGSQEKLTEEFWDHLASKTVYVVHDCDVDGQAGGQQQAQLAAAAGAVVRHVTLPYEITKKHGKDLRDWLAEGHGYKELLRMAEAAPAVEPPPEEESPTEAASPVEQDLAVCEAIGLDVLGERPGREIVVYAQGKTDTIAKISRFTYDDLLQVAGPVVRQRVHQSAEATVPGQYRFSRVREAIAVLAGQQRLRDQTARGAGVWPCPGGLVLVGCREAAIWNLSQESLERVQRPKAAGVLLDLDSSEPWFDFQRLQDDLKRASDPQWRQDVLNELDDLTRLWRWEADLRGPTATLLAGLVLATWVQTTWKWRPHVALTGESASGKSTFLESLDALFGPLGLLTGKTSEAGLRQRVRNRACAILLDEFESDRHRNHILELLRTSGTGGRILRGTVNQGGIEFGLRHIAWVGAIEVGMERQPDANRYLTFEMLLPLAEQQQGFRAPASDDLADLGQRTLALAVRCSRVALELAAGLRGTAIEGLDGRTVESLAVPSAMLAAVLGLGENVGAAREVLTSCAACIAQQARPEPDQVELMQAILSSHVVLDKGERTTVAQILSSYTGFRDAPEPLERVGLAVVSDSNAPRGFSGARTGLFLDTRVIRRHLLSDTRWADQSIDTILLRLAGAERARRRIGSRNCRGILLEWPAFEERFLGDDEDALDTSTASSF